MCVRWRLVFLGIYALPILTAPASPTSEETSLASSRSAYTGHFRRDLKDSDVLHWGEGTLSVGNKNIVLAGKLAPGPDYKLYLSPEFVETEADFMRLKARMVRVGNVLTFENFIVPVPETIDISERLESTKRHDMLYFQSYADFFAYGMIVMAGRERHDFAAARQLQ